MSWLVPSQNDFSVNSHWAKTCECGADGYTCKTHLGDRCVNDTLFTELV